MDNITAVLLLVVLLLAIGAGAVLLNGLIANTVPSALAPLANHWTKAGRDQTWIRSLMWILFGVCVFLVFGMLFIQEMVVQVKTYLLLLVFLIAIGAGGSLLKNLGSNTVPSALVPVADHWTKAGREQKWIRRFMWFLFGVCALFFFEVLLRGIYKAVLQLGQKWHG